MKEIPILFSTPMVQAELEYRKTMTRRTRGLEKINENPNDWQFEWADFCLEKPWRFTYKPSINEQSLADRSFYQEELKCPYGKPGDVLWVRETFCPMIISDYDGNGNDYQTYLYKTEPGCNDILSLMEDETWKPSIHMPKAAARIWLEVEKIKVERLQDISEEDAKAEGIEEYGPFGEYKGSKHPSGGSMRFRAYQKASRAFQDLWEEINGEGSWKKNPWVWVVEFKILSIDGRPQLETLNLKLETTKS